MAHPKDNNYQEQKLYLNREQDIFSTKSMMDSGWNVLKILDNTPQE